MTHAKPHSKGVNQNHLQKYRDKIKELEEIIQKYREAFKRLDKGWTNNLFFYILGVSSAVAFWIWWMVCSLVF